MMHTSSRRVSSSTTDSSARARLAAGGLAVAFAFSLLAGTAFAEDAAAGGAIDAKKLWTKNCQSCHGPDGKGKTKAGEKAKVKDLTSAEVKAKLDKAKALASMKDGIKEEGSDKLAMKSYSDKLSDAEMDALADYSLAFK